MAPSKSRKEIKTTEAGQDLISNLPENVTDKIIKRLTIPMSARTSVLSRKWNQIWRSHRYLVFDIAFWYPTNGTDKYDLQKASTVISNILFNHSGHIHEFHLVIPWDLDEPHSSMIVSQWLSFLSRTSVKKIALLNLYEGAPMPSHVFLCKELVKLRLECFVLNRLPFNFKGFAHLRNLELVEVALSHDKFSSLISNCPRLAVLRLEIWTGMNHPIINIPSLESLSIKGVFESLSLKNATHLINVSLHLFEMKKKSSNSKTVDAIKSLASSCELRQLEIGDQLCKFLAAGGLTRSLPLAFKYMNRLRLTELDLGDSDVSSCTFYMIESCPFITDLEITVIPSSTVCENRIEKRFDNYKLGRLLKVKITGIKGSRAELLLIEYVLAVSVVLEKLLYRCGSLDAESELKLSRDMMRFPRASNKAQLVYIEK